jgi:hypothetical protein
MGPVWTKCYTEITHILILFAGIGMVIWEFKNLHGSDWRSIGFSKASYTLLSRHFRTSSDNSTLTDAAMRTRT